MAYYSDLLPYPIPSDYTREPQPDFPNWLPPIPEQRRSVYPSLLGMGPQVPVVPGYDRYPGLLRAGSPYQFANVASPFANLLTDAGTLPIPSFTTPDLPASPAPVVPAQLLAAAPRPPRGLLMDDDYDGEVFDWGTANEYNPDSIPFEGNIGGALGNLFSFPGGLMAGIVANAIFNPEKNYSVERGGPVGIGLLSLLSDREAELEPFFTDEYLDETQREENLGRAEAASLDWDEGGDWADDDDEGWEDDSWDEDAGWI